VAITGSPSSYATPTDLANVGALPAFTQSLTAAQQTEAIQNASAFMDSYFSSRFMLPLVTWTYDVTLCCAQIAIYYLVQARGYNPNNPAEDTYRVRYEQCINWLKDVARGQATPQITDSSSGAAPGVPTPSASPNTVSPTTGTPAQGTTWGTWARR
jgi:phage gp36-like protein